MSEDTEVKDLKKKLFSQKENGWLGVNEEKEKLIFKFADEYMYFLNNGKTERECVKFAKKMLEENGFKDILSCENLVAGDKVYYINRNKSVYAAVVGKEKIENGLNIVGAHIDSPRLDLKPNPLYEEGGLAYFKTHYYGGIKKYQWTTIPLSMHGVIVKTNGEKVEINIGESDEEPVFTITDLLPHLAMEQMERKLKEGVKGEDLNLLIGSRPYGKEESSDCVKLNILSILNSKYGIVEEDFESAEIELVPAFKARTLGFDGSMVAGYGQDDKVCSYATIRALLDTVNPTKTAVCILSDKEEIGSMGNTGMESLVFDYFISELLNRTGENKPDLIRKVFNNSRMLSADVDAGFDPIYASVSDTKNAGYLGKGISLNKYTGARGKSGASDANAEFVAEVRSMLDKKGISYQLAELGKVDIGGGGTIAYILANKGADVIDCGVPVLSMHAPYEVTSKIDIYAAFETYKAFFE